MASSDIVSTKENASVKDREMEEMTLTSPDYSDPKAKRKLMLIIATLCTLSFLAAFDNILISSNMPTVAEAFNAFNLYSWPNTAFLLTSATIGTVLCSAAQNMVMFIVARAFCGLGIGAFDTLMKIVVADYIPLRYIGRYQSYLGASWSLGYIVGGLLGGVVISQTQTGWRSIFFLCLGVGFIALILTIISIEEPTRNTMSMQRLADIDLAGSAIWSIAIVCLVLALSWGGSTYPWSAPSVITLLCIAGVGIIIFAVWELKYAKQPIIPKRLFTNRSVVAVLVAAWLYGGCFQSLMTYVPLYLSVIRKEEAMATNLELLCLVLVACIANVITGLVIVKTGHYTWAMRSSLVVLSISCGLLTLLKVDSSRGLIVGLMIVTGVGAGGIINSEIITAQASVAYEFVPIITPLMTFCDQVGGIFGIAIVGSILSNKLYDNIAALNLTDVSSALVRQSSSYMDALPEPARTLVLHAYADAVNTSYWGSAAFAIVAFLATLLLKHYNMREGLK
ncbi:major facilitator superfamily domain-containing protein [Umbelopsis sp. PMI_123]|nr:major facilitator superfamily domain-containing protein [Umbelopsis sp. PMI_123]